MEFDELDTEMINIIADSVTTLLNQCFEDCPFHIAAMVVASAQIYTRPDVIEFYGSARSFHRKFSHMLADILKVDRMSDMDE